MEGLNKMLAGYTDILFFIVVMEAFLIIILLAYVLYKRWDVKEIKASYSSHNDIQYLKSIHSWQNECHNLQVELNRLKKERKSLHNNQDSHSSVIQKNRWESNSNNEQTGINRSYNGYEEYVNNEIRKGIYVQETMNDDGTVKREIDFNIKDEEPVPVPKLTPRKYEFLEAANGGQFRKLLPTEDKCFFRTWEENGIRMFEFHGNVDKALANINAIFDDVCEIEGKQNGATQIENSAPGTLTSQLKVDIKAKIKLI